MQIAVLSDSHSRYHAIEDALAILRDRGVGTVIHCGDIDDGEAVWRFRGFTAHFVYGNCDRSEKHAIRAAVEQIGATLHEPFGSLELEGIKIAFLHGDDARLMRDVENAGHFDFLFYGHTHQADERRTGPTRVINPGALHRARPKTFVLLDLTTGAVESIALNAAAG
jgi:putative phosphoesterase